VLQAQHRYRLSEAPGAGVDCDEDGLFVAGVPLLEQSDVSGWRARPVADLDRDLSKAYGMPVTLEAKVLGLAATARALGNGELARAQMTALFLRLPEPPPLSKVTPPDLTGLAHLLEFSGLLKREWNPDLHPRWPIGSPGGVGGEFAPAETGGAATAHLTSDQGLSIPMDIPLDEPLVRPLPTEIAPPPITGPIPRNPYPARPSA